MPFAFRVCFRLAWPIAAGRLACALGLPLPWGATVALTSSGCSVPQRGATAANLGQAERATPDGSLVFQSYCAECHGVRGEGTAEHPAIVGDAALSSFKTALDLHEYIQAHMPKLGKAELAAADYWTVASFVVTANGVEVPEGGLAASNASAVMLHAD